MSAFGRYQEIVIGRSLWSLIKYEFVNWCAPPVPGAGGYLLLKMLIHRLGVRGGVGTAWERGVVLRHPHKMGSATTA